MANKDAPSGLVPVKSLQSNAYNGQIIRCSIPASDGTATFVNDPVKLSGSSDADGVTGVIQAAAGNAIFGVIVGFEVLGNDLSVKHRLASTLRYALVNIDPFALFEIQDDSVGGDLTAGSVGANFDLIIGAGSTVTGISGVEIDSSTTGTVSAQVQIISHIQRSDNTIGTNSKWLCRIVEHQMNSTTGV